MRRSVFVSASLLLASQAVAQVRPEDCAPVFPVIDQVAAVAPTDVVAEQAVPEAVAKRRFFGLPFLLPLIGGGIIAATTHHHDHNQETVSPA
jgi:hypothetical protein